MDVETEVIHARERIDDAFGRTAVLHQLGVDAVDQVFAAPGTEVVGIDEYADRADMRLAHPAGVPERIGHLDVLELDMVGERNQKALFWLFWLLAMFTDMRGKVICLPAAWRSGVQRPFI